MAQVCGAGTACPAGSLEFTPALCFYPLFYVMIYHTICVIECTGTTYKSARVNWGYGV